MNITNYERLIEHLYKVGQDGFAAGINRYVPLMTWGEAGIGKSETVKRVSRKLGIGFIDLRLGQLETADLIGIPRPEKVYPSPYDQGPQASIDQKNARFSQQKLLWHIRQNHPEIAEDKNLNAVLKNAIALVEKNFSYMIDFRSVYSTPDWFPPPHSHGILFLDELNRSASDVRQAIFQLILDREMHGLQLPPGWIIISANNPDSDEEQAYDVEAFDDPAFLSRFLHIAMEPTAEEWLEYARSREVAPSILATIAAHPNLLSRQTGEDDIVPNLQPTPRSWMMLNSILPLDPDLLVEVAMGLVGTDATTVWKQIQLSPERPVTGEEILEDYDRQHKRLMSFMEHKNPEGNLSPRIDMVHMTFESMSSIFSKMKKDGTVPDTHQYAQIEKFLMANARDPQENGLGNFDMATSYLRNWAMKYQKIMMQMMSNPDIIAMVRKGMMEQGQVALVEGAASSSFEQESSSYGHRALPGRVPTWNNPDYGRMIF